MLGVAQPLRRHHPRAPALAAAGAGRRDALADALADQVAFHLGECRLDLQKGTAGRGCGIKRSVKGAKTHATAIQLVHKPDQLAGASPEPVEVQYDQHVIAAEIVQARAKAGPVGAGSTAAVVIDALTAGG